ncbi:MAG: hypothetical protein OEU92_15075, partial [Alphaproteobacteria bacterium]|nr:hypothetical protein [Alphaproteobacteria bacterium]
MFGVECAGSRRINEQGNRRCHNRRRATREKSLAKGSMSVSDITLDFSREEYQERIRKTRVAMESY